MACYGHLEAKVFAWSSPDGTSESRGCSPFLLIFEGCTQGQTSFSLATPRPTLSPSPPPPSSWSFQTFVKPQVDESKIIDPFLLNHGKYEHSGVVCRVVKRRSIFRNTEGISKGE